MGKIQTTTDSTVPNRSKGDRDAHGRFVKGCKPGPGNPDIRRQASWRQAFDLAVDPADFRQAVQKLVDLAKAGEEWALTLLLKYCVPEPVDVELLAKIEALEQRIIKGGGDECEYELSEITSPG